MAITIQNIFDGARAFLQGGDPSTAFGFGNAKLQPFLNQAYTEMWQTMEQVQSPRVQREIYFLVPKNTTYVDPESIGITDIGEPEHMWERGSLTSFQIATTDTSSPIQVTTVTPHGLATGAEVTIGQVINTPSPWGRWFVTVLDSLNLTLNGSVSDGNAGIGGQLTVSNERFWNRQVMFIREETDRQPTSRLYDCLWEGGIFRFRGATQDAQVRVSYYANATLPANATANLSVSGADAFLITRTASLAAAARGWPDRAAELETQALGPGRQADGRGGLLRGFLNIQVQGMQRTVFRKRPFRSNTYAEGEGNDFIYGSQSL